MFAVQAGTSNRAIQIHLKVDERPLSMELDTGASVSVVSEQVWKTSFSNKPLNTSPVLLKTYSGQTLKVVGERQVDVTYEGVVKRWWLKEKDLRYLGVIG